MTKREGVGRLDLAVDCRLWGKEKHLSHPYPVVCHLLDTAVVFAVLWDRLLGPPKPPPHAVNSRDTISRAGARSPSPANPTTAMPPS
jgi:hypothetical protein